MEIDAEIYFLSSTLEGYQINEIHENKGIAVIRMTSKGLYDKILMVDKKKNSYAVTMMQIRNFMFDDEVIGDGNLEDT